MKMKGTSRGSAILAALVAAMVAGAGTAAADTVLWVGGTSGSIGRLIPPGTFGAPSDILGGAFVDDDLRAVDYPSALWPVTGLFDPTLGRSVATGVANLKAAVRDSSGPLIVAGVSQGAMVVQQAQAELNGDPTVPSDTTFILIADPNRGVLSGLPGVYLPVIDYAPRPVSETRFTTIVVTHQYDGLGEPIRRPWNLLTDLNALMGTAYVHTTAHNAGLSEVPPSNITVTTNSQGGTTTNYLVPTEHLPLTMPLRAIGVPEPTVDAIDEALRPVIDEGYRPVNDPIGNTGRGSRAAAAPAESTAAAPRAARAVRVQNH